MKRIMDQYAERSGRSRPALRFLIDGVRVNDEDTPDSLEMEDGDVVEVHQEQIGGYGRMMSEVIVHDGGATSSSATQMMIGLEDGEIKLVFNVKPDIKMKRVMDYYVERSGRRKPTPRFLVNGASITDDDTPESLMMEHGDTVEVHSDQIGEFRMLPDTFDISLRDDDTDTFFKVAPGLKMKHVMDWYAERSGRNRATLRFLFDGERIVDNSTPRSLQMEHGDVVYVHLEEPIDGLRDMPSSELSISFKYGEEELFFKDIPRTIKMKHVFDKYMEQSGKSRAALRFTLLGECIEDNDTPEDCGMADGDIVEVHSEEVAYLGSMLSTLVVE